MKSNNEVLSQLYLSAKDLQILIPNLSIYKARKYISDARKEMEDKNCFIPQTKEKLALTKFLKRKFKF